MGRASFNFTARTSRSYAIPNFMLKNLGSKKKEGLKFNIADLNREKTQNSTVLQSTNQSNHNDRIIPSFPLLATNSPLSPNQNTSFYYENLAL